MKILSEFYTQVKKGLISRIWIGVVLKKKFLNTTANSSIIKLHLGCGRHILQGWINIDNGGIFNNKSNMDIVCDLRYGIPCDDNSVDFIFHEHLIEHLSRPDGVRFTRECWRKLKVGGVLRVAYPDLDTAIANYLRNYSDFEWYYSIYPKRRGLTSSEIFNLNIRESGHHKHIYNKADIMKLMVESGFLEKNVSFHTPGESPLLELRGIEKRLTSVCLECVK